MRHLCIRNSELSLSLHLQSSEQSFECQKSRGKSIMRLIQQLCNKASNQSSAHSNKHSIHSLNNSYQSRFSLGALNPSTDPQRELYDSSSSSSAASDDDGGLTETAGRTNSSTTTTSTPASSAPRTRSSRDGARTRYLFGGDPAAGGRGQRPGGGDPNPFLQGIVRRNSVVIFSDRDVCFWLMNGE